MSYPYSETASRSAAHRVERWGMKEIEVYPWIVSLGGAVAQWLNRHRETRWASSIVQGVSAVRACYAAWLNDDSSGARTALLGDLALLRLYGERAGALALVGAIDRIIGVIQSFPAARPTILVADDEFDILDLMANLLQSAGYDVLPAAHVEDALSILEKSLQVDLLVTDIVFPGERNGFALAQIARQMRPGLKLLYTTGFFAISDPEAMPVVPAPLLRKPFRAEQLTAEVSAVLLSSDAPALI